MWKKLKAVGKNIADDVESWLYQSDRFHPLEIANRRKSMRQFNEVIRAALGILIIKKIISFEESYIFEGLRNKEYMSFFKPSSVFIVGSHLEKKYAQLYGHNFIWSFPVVSAVRLKLSRTWNLFIIAQLYIWRRRLKSSKKVIFFLYEDTQPLGVFFVHLGRLYDSRVKTVCIQHGYFCKLTSERRYDGLLCDINFLWDKKQINLIKCNATSAFEVGLPYTANAQQDKDIILVFVGIGIPYNGTDDYEKSLNVFSEICKKIIDDPRISIVYRPHPNEWAHVEIINDLRGRYKALDNLSVLERLNGPRAIFIGTISSLLYEAGVAGHIIAHMKLHKEMTVAFHKDFDFDVLNIDIFVDWIIKVISREIYFEREEKSTKYTPIERFSKALYKANLLS